MALKVAVKVSNVTNLSDARYCAGMGADLIGFPIDDPLNDDLIAKYKAIIGWLSGVEIVGEFASADPELIQKADDLLNLNIIEIVADEHTLLPKLTKTVMLKLYADQLSAAAITSIIEKFANDVDWFDIDVKSNADISSDFITTLPHKDKIFISFGFNANNLDNFLNKTNCKGLGLKGGEEVKVGLKDFEELADILEKLEIED